ncbi:MAG: response regulator transcription factor [Kordiimonadaceae bacterium]|jgi:DNA-binding response OmpR family regulator|nr:response regulator transcription factor [Kordiimonadaceae bacterium]MBT6031548.1 response regulator transcription factor [Kordiimonadaceae bacterium]
MAHIYNILLVDDDTDLRENLALQLSFHEEFQTQQCGDGKCALDTVKENDFDIIVLDVGLPDIDGREVCRMMRKLGVSTPIVMLTANVSEADTILGLDAGANDYVTKPFKFGILLARIRAHLRQHLISEDASYPVGHYTFKPGEKILTNLETDEKIRLTEKETAILKFLRRADGGIITREKMLTEVWGYNSNVTTHTLETHVYRLRQKIEIDPSHAKIILTEAGGYSMGNS